MQSLPVFGNISFGRKAISSFNFSLRTNKMKSNTESFTSNKKEKTCSSRTGQGGKGWLSLLRFESSETPFPPCPVRDEPSNTHYT